MGADSKIEWTDHTFNPWWGCQRVSPGCEHCYAETFAKRTGHSVWGVTAERRFFGENHWAEPLKWNTSAEKQGVRERVFCASMADVFEELPELHDAHDTWPPSKASIARQRTNEAMRDARSRLWRLIRDTPALDWLLLTKRPESVDRLAMGAWADAFGYDTGTPGVESAPASIPWLPNIWLGTTCEDQMRADERIPHLLATGAAVRFLSCEPLLGPISFRPRAESVAEMRQLMNMGVANKPDMLGGIDWVIAGGESGPGARHCDVAWIRSIVAQCRDAGVACFVKQMGSRPAQWGEHEGHHGLVNVRLRDRKGGAMDEWPSDLRVREFPATK